MKSPKLIIPLIVLSLLLAGCTSSSKKTNLADGGVFKSTNQGLSWSQKGLLANTQGKQLSIGAVNNASLAQDPNDNQALYFGSIGNGLFYTYNGGDSWNKAGSLGNASVRAIAVAPGDKCRIYAAVDNKLYRSDDCNRSYEQIYYDNELDAPVDAVTVDHYDSNIVYIGVTRNNRADLIRSNDQGDSWQTIARLNDKISKIVIDPADSRRLYIATPKRGAHFSPDAGTTWVDWTDVLKDNDLGSEVRDIVVTSKEEPKIFIATTYGLLRSSDGAETWEKIKLIPPEKNATINAIAVNPQNDQEIYYVTYTTFFRSIDGGENWSPAKLPTSRAGWKIIVDPIDQKTVYLSVRSFEK